jgi:hypothetical protein
MLLFSRIVTPNGPPRRALAFALEATSYVNANSSLNVTCWTGTFGHPIGTVGWSTFVESQAALAASTADLLSQDAYHDLLESAADLVGTPGQDFLREIVHGQPSGPPPIGAVATVTTATAVVDRMAEATLWGIAIAQQVEAATGSPVGVGLDLYGPMGAMTWIGVAENPAAADAARAALRADSAYLDALQGSKGLFIPGSGHVAQVTRIG